MSNQTITIPPKKLQALRAAGLTGDQIVAALEAEGIIERQACAREKTRIRVRNHRARNAVTPCNATPPKNDSEINGHVTPCNAGASSLPFPPSNGFPSYSPSLTTPLSISPKNILLKKEKNPSGFDQFWAAYPRREGKKKAASAFAKALKETTLEAILAALERKKPSWHDPQFIPHPATWLNQGRWLDELAPKPKQSFPV